MTECDEVADTMRADFKELCRLWRLKGRNAPTQTLALIFVRRRMPEESEAVIANVAWSLFRW